MTDTDRLDWLIDQGPPGAAAGMGLNEETWEAAYGMVEESIQSDRECVRAAIDAAIAIGEGQ